MCIYAQLYQQAAYRALRTVASPLPLVWLSTGSELSSKRLPPPLITKHHSRHGAIAYVKSCPLTQRASPAAVALLLPTMSKTRSPTERSLRHTLGRFLHLKRILARLRPFYPFPTLRVSQSCVRSTSNGPPQVKSATRSPRMFGPGLYCAQSWRILPWPKHCQ